MFMPHNTSIFSGLLLLLASLFFSACRTQAVVTNVAPKKKSVKFLLRKIKKNHIDFEWFGTRAKVKFDTEERKVTAFTKIRMQKDSLIWISIKKMNIEGARVKITPQTIEVLDRQEHIYIRKPFASIKEDYGLAISFTDLQDLLIGNPILYKNEKWQAAIEEKRNVLRTPPTQKEVLKIFLSPASFLLDELRGSQNNNALSITYSDYEKISGQNIPTKKNIYIDSEENGTVEVSIDFNKTELNVPQKVRFNIPDSYRK